VIVIETEMNTTKQNERNLWDARGWSSGEIVVLKVCDSKGPMVGSSSAVAEYFQDDARAIREWFRVLYVNSKNEIILNKLEFLGTVDSSPVYPREIMIQALQCGAASLVLAHNHPSGDPEPSYMDKDITKAIIFAAMTLQIKVLDHVIIGASKTGGKAPYFSFADHGEIETYTGQALSYSRLT
jgi:DNA repair protein RadC